MHLFREGDRSEAICHACEKRVKTQFAVRTVRLAETGLDVPDVLAAVCDECGGVAAIPAQSAPKLKEARERRKAEELEARIPSHLDDVVHLLSDHFAAAVASFRPSLLRFYLREVASDADLADRVKVLAGSDLAQGRARARVSLRAPEGLLRDVRGRARQAGIASDADLIRGILLAAKEDVLEGGAPERRMRLGGAAQAEGAPRPAAL
jgi:hypothetical protein